MPRVLAAVQGLEMEMFKNGSLLGSNYSNNTDTNFHNTDNNNNHKYAKVGI